MHAPNNRLIRYSRKHNYCTVRDTDNLHFSADASRWFSTDNRAAMRGPSTRMYDVEDFHIRMQASAALKHPHYYSWAGPWTPFNLSPSQAVLKRFTAWTLDSFLPLTVSSYSGPFQQKCQWQGCKHAIAQEDMDQCLAACVDRKETLQLV